VFAGSARGTFRNNTVTGNSRLGLQVAGSAGPTISGNTFEGGEIGVLYVEDGRGQASGNTLRSLNTGIEILGRATPAIEGNVMSSISADSILVSSPATPSISGNSCDPNSSGIVLVGGASPSLGSNDCAISSRG
jgi:parallel beta-helix repeat protein